MTTAQATARELDLSAFTDGVNAKFLPYFIIGGKPASPKALKRFIVLMGGAGSGKSKFAAQDFVVRAVTEVGHTLLALRKVGRTLRASCFQNVLNVLRDFGWSGLAKVNRSDMTVTFPLFNSIILFSGLDDSEKMKSIESITSIWIEEATEFTEADFNQINIRLRGLFRWLKRITITFNPISVYSWLKARFWDNAATRARAEICISTYLDNRFLDPEYAAEIEAYKEIDRAFYEVYALAQWGTFKGLIYTTWETMTDYPKHPDDTYYGLDFGFNKPTALVRVDEKDDEGFLTEIIYEAGLTNTDLIAKLDELGVSKDAPIYCDSAEPDRIEELCRAGYNAKPADKAVSAGIISVKSMKLHTRPENVNLNREASTYKWAEDRDGNLLDQPVKLDDHLMDATRYAVHTHRGSRAPVYAGGGRRDVRPR